MKYRVRISSTDGTVDTLSTWSVDSIDEALRYLRHECYRIRNLDYRGVRITAIHIVEVSDG